MWKVNLLKCEYFPKVIDRIQKTCDLKKKKINVEVISPKGSLGHPWLPPTKLKIQQLVTNKNISGELWSLFKKLLQTQWNKKRKTVVFCLLFPISSWHCSGPRGTSPVKKFPLTRKAQWATSPSSLWGSAQRSRFHLTPPRPLMLRHIETARHRKKSRGCH